MRNLSSYHKDITHRLIHGADPRACTWHRWSRLLALRNAVSLRLIGAAKIGAMA